MAVEIIPAVLARRSKELNQRFQLAQKLSGSIHLDVMDGKFVPTKSVSPSVVNDLTPRSSIELHLMTKKPENWLATVKHLKIERVILHVELGQRLKRSLALYRSHRIAVILAINPKTPVSRLAPWIKYIQGILVMGVQPGKYGAKWQSATPNRINTISHRYPNLLVACDGGLNPTTIPLAVKAGARRLIIGSYLQFHRQPRRAWSTLRLLADRPIK